MPATLKGETLTIPLGAIAPGFVAPKFEVPINGFTYSIAACPNNKNEFKINITNKENFFINILIILLHLYFQKAYSIIFDLCLNYTPKT